MKIVSDMQTKHTQKEIRKILEKATVVLRIGDSDMPNGTGWLFSSRGYILTAGHVLKNAPDDMMLIDECSICFNWDKSKGQENDWIKAKLCFGINNEDKMLDYAILKIMPEKKPEDCFPIPIWTGDYPYDMKCSVLGYHAKEERIVFLTDVMVTGDSGKKYLRLEDQSLTEGFSGSAIFAISDTIFGVLGIQVARYEAGTQGHVEIDTRFGLPLNRIIEHWPPFEDLLITGGVAASEINEPLIVSIYIDDLSVVQRPSQIDLHKFKMEIHNRISALTKGEVKEDLLRCDLLKRLGGLPIAKDICYMGLLFLWLTAELERSKKIIVRLRKVYILIQAILRDSLFHYKLLLGGKYNAVNYYLLKSIETNIDKLYKEAYSTIYDNSKSQNIEFVEDDRLTHYLKLRTGLSEDQVNQFTLSLKTVKSIVAAIPSDLDTDNPDHTKDKWEKYLENKGDGLCSPLDTLSRFTHIQKGIERTLNGLIDDTMTHLRDAFAVVDEIVDGEVKKAKLIQQVPLEDVVLEAILKLPQNSTGPKPWLRAWPTDISLELGITE